MGYEPRFPVFKIFIITPAGCHGRLSAVHAGHYSQPHVFSNENNPGLLFLRSSRSLNRSRVRHEKRLGKILQVPVQDGIHVPDFY